MAIDEVRGHLNVIIDWSLIGRCQSMLINNNQLSLIDRLLFRSSIFIDCPGPDYINPARHRPLTQRLSEPCMGTTQLKLCSSFARLAILQETHKPTVRLPRQRAKQTTYTRASFTTCMCLSILLSQTPHFPFTWHSYRRNIYTAGQTTLGL